MHDTEDPIVQAQQMIAEARQAFARDVDGLLAEIRGWTACVHDTSFEEVSRADLLRALRAFVVEKFEQRLPPPRSLADVLQLQVQHELIGELLAVLKAARDIVALGADVLNIQESTLLARVDDAIAKAEGADV